MTTYSVIAPQNESFPASAGGYYSPGPGLIIQNVADADVVALIKAGCTLVTANLIRLPMLQWAGSFAPLETAGQLNLVGGVTNLTAGFNAATATDSGAQEIVLPDDFAVGAPISVIVNAAYFNPLSGSPGTIVTSTLAATLSSVTDGGAIGSNLVSTGAAALSSSPTDYTFAADGTSLAPGQRIIVGMTASNTSSGGSNATAINSVRFSYWSTGGSALVGTTAKILNLPFAFA